MPEKQLHRILDGTKMNNLKIRMRKSRKNIIVDNYQLVEKELNFQIQIDEEAGVVGSRPKAKGQLSKAVSVT